MDIGQKNGGPEGCICPLTLHEGHILKWNLFEYLNVSEYYSCGDFMVVCCLKLGILEDR